MSKSDKNNLRELILAVRAGEEDAFVSLLEMYTPMLVSTGTKLGLEYEDYYSEACITLYNSAFTFDLEQSEVTFGLYAGVCVRNKLYDLVRRKSANEKRLDRDIDVETLATSDGIVSSLIRREERETLCRVAKDVLSDYEYRVFELWLSGESETATAKTLGSGVKSIENARGRILKKLRGGMPQRDN